ncbi:TfoX/Sxy family DNA transformation protein [Salinivibrio sp. ES.052]|uniref:TfoX/Sxy family DNA transformation protein n=1 Tax=Salinivibrio sp. ES.052 TaxID=1882823 RepID=UPI00092AEFCD|nr:TfoX/Sxy family DNA transformation protein [Salinivibrio sp. ES.052]SIN80727.1 regulator of competence-specific genes [Salinivibrio sp. ES.052]
MEKQFRAQVMTFLNNFGDMELRSMFGGTGFFYQGAMFALLTGKRFYLRGGSVLSNDLLEKGCDKFVHVKKSSSAVVNYYDVTELHISGHPDLNELTERSLAQAVNDKARKTCGNYRRLRDLPNLRLTIERMLKKSGVEDVSTFYSMAPEEMFRRLQVTHGKDVDLCLLWKLAGAQQGRHWKLIEQDERERLLSAV